MFYYLLLIIIDSTTFDAKKKPASADLFRFFETSESCFAEDKHDRYLLSHTVILLDAGK